MIDDDPSRTRWPVRTDVPEGTQGNGAYLEFLQQRAEAGRHDPVRYTDEQVGERMQALRAKHGA